MVLGNIFGKCIGGNHSLLKENIQKIIQHAAVLCMDKVRINDFYDIKTMGFECSPKLGGSRSGKCPIGGKQFTLKEERKLHQIEEGLTYMNDHWKAKYPWIRYPNELPNNKIDAFGMLKSTERRLLRNSKHAEMYSSLIQDLVEKGVV